MTTKSHSQQPDLIFVDGPSLNCTPTDNKSQSARSALMRRVYTDRLSRYRSEQALKLNQMLQAQRAVSTTRTTCQQDVGNEMVLRAHDTIRRNIRTLRPKGCISVSVTNECGSTVRGPRDPAANAATIPSPQSLISTGRLDPFMPNTIALGPAYNELTYHMIKVIWPAFRDVGHARRCYMSWMAEPDREILTCAYLFASSVHRDGMRIIYGPENTDFESKEQLVYKGMTLRLLRERLSGHLSSGVSDSLIMGILYLAAHPDPKAASTKRDLSPFTPPFIDLHALNIYGTCPTHPSHWRMVHQCVQLRGGIQTLKLYRLGWLLSLCDLMNAANTLTKPTYPLYDLEGRPFIRSPPLLMLRVPELARHLTYNQGFSQLRLLNPPVKSCITSVFLHLCQLSQALHTVHTSDSSMLQNLGDCRNLVHHQLLSLPSQNDPPESILDEADTSMREINQSRDIYLMCRYSALLYAIHVTFPLPRSLKNREILLSAVRTSLSRVIGSVTELTPLELLLWPSIIAAISAGDRNSNRRWFVSMVQRLCQELAIWNWAHLLGILRSFAWVDAAGNQGAFRVWTEVILGLSSCNKRVDYTEYKLPMRRMWLYGMINENDNIIDRTGRTCIHTGRCKIFEELSRRKVSIKYSSSSSSKFITPEAPSLKGSNTLFVLHCIDCGHGLMSRGKAVSAAKTPLAHTLCLEHSLLVVLNASLATTPDSKRRTGESKRGRTGRAGELLLAKSGEYRLVAGRQTTRRLVDAAEGVDVFL
ncbi:conserved hypothetical protein [Talaromyces stipitatus ATCC 10500]|uniref:Uncharacterized protein n=1 Tax=Talaromyces stipitatus (strain ATCC 10500 / CBS 375.48 / QM 6759 / NRRL 1006) TaxID=441959 RepID=B8MPU2_TALSN|nr:uncharacterized protein TSTA_052710 [Talaromyces stipitatus ATCC 10500]EED12750.1 conserved hypothetical protein [Talaromyces stipitatus ATCC 10500]